MVEEEEQPPLTAEQMDLEDEGDGLPPKRGTMEWFFEESANTDWLIDDVKDQHFLEHEQDDSDTDEQDEGD